MSSSDRMSMPLVLLGLVALALLALWYLSKTPDVPGNGPPPVMIAPPLNVEVTIDPDGGECKFSASPDPVTLYKNGTDTRPNAATFTWVGEMYEYTHLWLILKDDGLADCLPFQNFPGGKRGFEIPRTGTDAKQVVNDAVCEPDSYYYGLLARHQDETFLECDPGVIIEN